jgi:hypothetical protein
VPGERLSDLQIGIFAEAHGGLMQIAGLSYLIACFAALFAPTFADLIIPAILLPPLIGESSFCLWLLIKAVDSGKCNERMIVGQRNRAADST